MGNSWTYGDAVYLARVLESVMLGDARAAAEQLRHPLAVRATQRVFALRTRGSAIALGLDDLPPPIPRQDLSHLEPAFLPQETADAE